MAFFHLQCLQCPKSAPNVAGLPSISLEPDIRADLHWVHSLVRMAYTPCCSASAYPPCPPRPLEHWLDRPTHQNLHRVQLMKSACYQIHNQESQVDSEPVAGA